MSAIQPGFKPDILNIINANLLTVSVGGFKKIKFIIYAIRFENFFFLREYLSAKQNSVIP